MMRRCEWCGWVLLETPEWWLRQCPNQSCSIVAVIIDDPEVELTGASLCTGILGLDLAVSEAFGGVDLRWCSEINPAASEVIAARSDSPNVGDFRDVTPPPVDVLTAGFPCQPVSSAGKRAGIDDERWLFDDICELLGRMDPPPGLLVFENVPGLLTANGGDAMGRVVHGLARLGYVGRWRTLRASDVGACHRRERVFIVARHAEGAARRGPEQQGVLAPGRAAAEPRESDSEASADWGPYEPAIQRWERVVGRAAPAPVDDRGRLSPHLVEWMMGYPDGWCTDLLGRSDALRCLGNAVVPQQAAMAIRSLL